MVGGLLPLLLLRQLKLDVGREAGSVLGSLKLVFPAEAEGAAIEVEGSIGLEDVEGSGFVCPVVEMNGGARSCTKGPPGVV